MDLGQFRAHTLLICAARSPAHPARVASQEYAQGLHGRKIDQIHTATLVPTESFLAPGRRIVDFRCGGSFSLLLDGEPPSWCSAQEK